MVGQKNLLNKLNSYNIDTFPRSVMLIGEKGSGKHTVIDYIKENIVKLPLIDISKDLSADYINAIYRNPNPMIYLIDLNDLTEKQQNVILTFIEEPLSNSFIIILTENKNTVLNTVINRCVCFEIEAYSKEELNSFLTSEDDKELILNILRTPGKIKNTNLSNLRSIVDVCDKIINKLSAASFMNTLSIADKINFKDEYDKFDLDIFLDSLIYLLNEDYIHNKNINSYKMYLYIINERKKLIDKRLNKEAFFRTFLIRLWKMNHPEKEKF